ncbi:hypothetical protein PLESTM_001083400 [Pleodorina starrii]|nr:hypothetical protein PLESTM_001083400 [Pleodorina starrii]
MRPALKNQLAVCLWISPIPARCRLLLQFALRTHFLRGNTSLLHQVAAVLQERPTRRAMEAARKALTEACEMSPPRLQYLTAVHLLRIHDLYDGPELPRGLTGQELHQWVRPQTRQATGTNPGPCSLRSRNVRAAAASMAAAVAVVSARERLPGATGSAPQISGEDAIALTGLALGCAIAGLCLPALRAARSNPKRALSGAAPWRGTTGGALARLRGGRRGVPVCVAVAAAAAGGSGGVYGPDDGAVGCGSAVRTDFGAGGCGGGASSRNSSGEGAFGPAVVELAAEGGAAAGRGGVDPEGAGGGGGGRERSTSAHQHQPLRPSALSFLLGPLP